MKPSGTDDLGLLNRCCRLCQDRAGVAAVLEGQKFIGIDNDKESIETSKDRIQWAEDQLIESLPLFAGIKK